MATTSTRFLFLLGSARVGGNTESLARYAALSLPSDVEQRWLRLSEVPLPSFQDLRHEGDGEYPLPTGNERLLLDATLWATDLVIVSPLYWYNVTASIKLYLDHWSAWLRVPGVEFKARSRGKTMWAVTASAGSDPDAAEPLVGTLCRSAEYLGMRWGGALLGSGTRPGDIAADTTVLDRASAFFPATPAPIPAG